MTNARITQLGWLGTLLGLFVACGGQVRNLGDEGSSGGVGNGTGGTTAVTTEATGGATGGASQATGGASQATGGAPQATGGASQATSGATAGSTAQGGTGNATGSGGSAGATVTVNCPAYISGTGDTLITPPSTGFESSLGSWTTTAGNASVLSLNQGATTACEGTSYLVCNGPDRQGTWDGPVIDLLPYFVTGHQYAVALAVRFDPANSPATRSTVLLTIGMTCADSSVGTTVYKSLQELAISPSSDWTRMSATLQTTLDTLRTSLNNCSPLAHLRVYVSTNETNAPYASLDVDDFQLWDVTPATGN